MSASRSFIESIEAELSDLRAELDAVSPLVAKLMLAPPDPIEMRAIATTVHTFYNAVERVLLLVAKRYGERQTAESHRWHRDLLVSMSDSTAARPAILSREMMQELVQFLGFRHFFRHSYPMQLDWERLQPLVKGLGYLPDALERELRQFIKGVS